MGNRAVFIDRDGTINANIGYIKTPQDFQMYPNIAEGIRLLNIQGFKVIIITNQSALSRGYLTKEGLDDIHQKMIHELNKKQATIDAIYYCPHHPDDHCSCRKPQPGLLKQAIKDHDINVTHSYLIGDRMLDVEAGNAIGCTTVLIPEKQDMVKKEMKESLVTPDHISDDFYAGVQWILSQS